jgi:hypothetical protein
VMVMVMVKTLGDANSQRRRAREDCNVNGDHLQRKMEWIQGDTAPLPSIPQSCSIGNATIDW